MDRDSVDDGCAGCCPLDGTVVAVSVGVDGSERSSKSTHSWVAGGVCWLLSLGGSNVEKGSNMGALLRLRPQRYLWCEW